MRLKHFTLSFVSWLVFSLAFAPASWATGVDSDCAAGIASPAVSPSAPLQPSFEVLSWNIQKASNSGWAEDLATIAADSQLVFIQEASLQAGIPELANTPEYEVFAPGYKTDSLDTGVMTLGSTSPSSTCQLSAMEPWLGTPKATSVAAYELDGRSERLLTINLHAVNFALGLKSFEQQLLSVAGVMGAHQGPIIFAGDLNTWSEARQQRVDDYMQEYGLSPVAFEPDLRTSAFGNPLDHIYVRGLRIARSSVIPMQSSDHNALRVQLELK